MMKLRLLFSFVIALLAAGLKAQAQPVSLNVMNDRATLKKHRVKSIVASSYNTYYDDKLSNPDSVKSSSFSSHTYTIDANGWNIQSYTAHSDGDANVIIKNVYSKNYTVCNTYKYTNSTTLESRTLVKLDKNGNRLYTATPQYCEEFKVDTEGKVTEGSFRSGSNAWKLSPEKFVYDSLGTFDRFFYDSMGNLVQTFHQKEARRKRR